MAVSSDEVNLLVYRYLLESGFTHSAFVFGYESFVHKSAHNGKDIPPGALITFVQKGLQYVEMEAQVTEDAADASFASLSAHDLLTKSLAELKLMVADARSAAAEQGMVALREHRERAADRDGAEPMDQDTMTARQLGEGSTAVSASDVSVLRGHEGEVFCVSWNPTVTDVLASGASDGTARIWHLDSSADPLVLPHGKDKDGKVVDITTVHWNSAGTRLLTATTNGIVRIFSAKGDLQHTMAQHQGPVFAAQWSPSGACVVSGSADRKTIVWNASNGHVRKEWTVHEAPVMDVSWRDDTVMATCSSDHTIAVYNINESRPLHRLRGHTRDINCVRWSSDGRLLASGSDDAQVCIWSGDTLLHTLKGHTREVYSVTWMPASADARAQLASSSFDACVRLWDVERGVAVAVLSEHTNPIYSLAFSSDGGMLASGSFDSTVVVWDVQEGRVVAQHGTGSPVYALAWDAATGKIAACLMDKTVCVLDLKKGE